MLGTGGAACWGLFDHHLALHALPVLGWIQPSGALTFGLFLQHVEALLGVEVLATGFPTSDMVIVVVFDHEIDLEGGTLGTLSVGGNLGWVLRTRPSQATFLPVFGLGGRGVKLDRPGAPFLR